MSTAGKPRALRLTPPPLPCPLESQEQEALIRRAHYQLARFPELKYLAAVPNGGFRHKREAAAMLRQGVNPGIPDLQLLVPRGGYAGWHGELKRIRGEGPSDDQYRWMAWLRLQGFWVGWHRGHEEMWADMEWYLTLAGTDRPTREQRPLREVAL